MFANGDVMCSSGRTCFLTVDGMFQLEDELPGFLAQLNTNSKLYIGQSYNLSKYPAVCNILILILNETFMFCQQLCTFCRLKAYCSDFLGQIINLSGISPAKHSRS